MWMFGYNVYLVCVFLCSFVPYLHYHYKVESGVTKDYQLKDKDCLQPSPTGSTIVINCNLIYNSVSKL